jgi:metal-responsive CopG/Arc/MetJ family transcriptional regulator
MATKPVAKPRKKPTSLVLLIMDSHLDLLKRVDDFRFENRFESRSEAIRWLLDFALKKNPRRQTGDPK